MNIKFLLNLAQKILPMIESLVEQIDGSKNPETKKKAQAAHDAVKALAEHKPSNTD